MRIRLARMTEMRILVEKGFAMLPAADLTKTARLRELRDYLVFVEREFPALLERWNEVRKGEQR